MRSFTFYALRLRYCSTAGGSVQYAQLCRHVGSEGYTMSLRALWIKLDTHQTQPEELPAVVEHMYLGGRGAVTWLLANRLPPNTGPLAPANLLIFSAGPLAGTGVAATGNFVVSTRSPLTGAIAHSWGHGRWGGELRRAG